MFMPHCKLSRAASSLTTACCSTSLQRGHSPGIARHTPRDCIAPISIAPSPRPWPGRCGSPRFRSGMRDTPLSGTITRCLAFPSPSLPVALIDETRWDTHQTAGPIYQSPARSKYVPMGAGYRRPVCSNPNNGLLSHPRPAWIRDLPSCTLCTCQSPL
jgi:hypothetical protein